MLNLKNWFTNNYENSTDFKLKFNTLLQSKYITSMNLEDFKNSNYDISEFDIFKYITALEYLIKNKNKELTLILNPYLVNNNKHINKSQYLVYNPLIEANQYKNLLIDLYFLDVPTLAHSSIPLDVLWNQVEDKTYITPYSAELKEIWEAGYGFEYFGKEATSLLFPLYLEAFYKNITLYLYKDKLLTFKELLLEYSQDRLSNNVTEFSVTKANYKSIINNKDNLDLEVIKNITNLINRDMIVTPLSYECNNLIKPLQLNDKFLIDYSLEFEFKEILSKHWDKSDKFVDSYVELTLKDLFKSNLNSTFIHNYIIS